MRCLRLPPSIILPNVNLRSRLPLIEQTAFDVQKINQSGMSVKEPANPAQTKPTSTNNKANAKKAPLPSNNP
jgi:hypothetical protein